MKAKVKSTLFIAAMTVLLLAGMAAFIYADAGANRGGTSGGSILGCEVYGASNVAHVKVSGGIDKDMDASAFEDFADDDLEDLEGKTITIDMYTDWDARSDSRWKDVRLVIPERSNTTINMNGHLFNRGRAKDNDWTSDGENICMNSGSTLTINGGDRSTSHKVTAYGSTAKGDSATASYTLKGGGITGGASTNGAGGIHMKSQTTLTLNSVTIAGCRAEESWSSDGYGGAICMWNSESTVTLNDSTLLGNYAYNDGGGIYSDSSKNKIYLVNSHIDHNYCDDDGAGICINGSKNVIKGDKKSTVSDNWAGDFEDYDGEGGGISLQSGDASVSRLTIANNKCKHGGGIYASSEGDTLSELVIKNNYAENDGGGIYVNNDETTINGCTITGNHARRGGGVWATAGSTDPVDADFWIKGCTVIKDNVDRSDADDSSNLTLESSSCRAMFDLTKGSDVRLAYFSVPSDNYFMVTQGSKGDTIKNKNCIKFMRAENRNYHITFNARANYRKIFFVKNSYKHADNDPDVGGRYQVNDPEDLSLKDGAGAPEVVGRVKAGGEKADNGQYQLIRGVYTHEKTDSSTEDTQTVFYYSDGLFYESPYTYNPHLGTASWNLAFSGTYLRAFEEPDANGNTYYNKHAGARQFMSDIGCKDQDIYVNDSLISKPGTDTIGVTIASKKLQKIEDGELMDTGDTLIAVTVRGGGYEAEWASNCTLGNGTARGGEAQGFSEAADQVIDEIHNYIRKYDLQDELDADKVKFWVTGFSRAGATANITSKRLVEEYAWGANAAGHDNQVFGYTCEAPKGGTDKAQKRAEDAYLCIHNMINTADVVPLVAPEQMGFKRYGSDHYIPGTDARDHRNIVKDTDDGITGPGSSGITTVSMWNDNEALPTKTDNYEARRAEMLKQLDAIDSGMVFDDYFHPMAMDFLIPPKMYEDGDYDGNRVEDFLVDFFRALMEGDGINDWTVAAKDRNAWVQNGEIGTRTTSSIQKSARDTMSLVFSMTDESSEGFIDRASGVSDKIGYIFGDVSMYDLYDHAIKHWHITNKWKYINFLWDQLEATGAFDYLSEDAVDDLEHNWPTLADVMLRFVEYDYYNVPGNYADGRGWAKGVDNSMSYIPTFATFAGSILSNHYPEINIAWARTYDSYYDDELTEYEFKKAGYKVDAPEAAVIDKDSADSQGDGGNTALEPDDEDANVLSGEQKIALDVSSVKGEAIYYDLENTKTGKKLEQNQIYRGGADIPEGEETLTTYKLTTYAMSYGVRSGKSTYYLNVYKDSHDVNIKCDDISWKRTYKSGNDVTVVAEDIAGKFFTEWTITDETGRDVTDILLSENESTSKAASFTMPAPGEDGFSYTYSLNCEASYVPGVETIDIDIEAPVAGEDLPLTADVTFDKGKPTEQAKTFGVIWKYRSGSDTYVDSGKARYNTSYSAFIPMDPTRTIKFSTNEIACNTTNGSVENLLLNTDTGRLTPELSFENTEAGLDPDDEYVLLTIKAYDLNAKDYDPGTEDALYYVKKGQSVTLTAQDVQDEVFSSWDFKDTGIECSDGSAFTDNPVTITIPPDAPDSGLTIDAQFIPVIKQVKAVLDTPVSGKALADTAHAFITITNEYEVHPDNLKVTWTPSGSGADGIANCGVAYTASIALKPDENGKIKARPAGGDDDSWEETAAVFVYSNELTATLNGSDVAFDTSKNMFSKTFEETEYIYAGFVQPEDISGLKHDTKPAEMLSKLPASVVILYSDGSRATAGVYWSDLNTADGDSMDEQVWEAEGTIELPENVENPDNVSTKISMTVTLDAAETAASPKASVDSGTYLVDQFITLNCKTDGAAVYYTTDGTEPTTASTRYDGETIAAGRDSADAVAELDVNGDPTGNKVFCLKAIAVKEGMRSSAVSTYEYVISNTVSVPQGKTLTYNGSDQEGVAAGIGYTLSAEEGSGVTIDKNGNAVARKAGTYSVTAKVDADSGFVWTVVTTDENGTETSETTTQDQTITFTVKPVSLADAKISVGGKVYTGKALKPALKSVVLNGVKLKTSDYNAVYTNNKKVGLGKVTINGKGNYTGKKSATFRITPKKPVIKKATAGKKKVTLKLKTKASKTGGKYYQVQYKIKGKKKWKTLKLKSKAAAKSKIVIKKLKKGKKYQIRTRAWKKVGKKKYYGKWSKVKTTKKIK